MFLFIKNHFEILTYVFVYSQRKSFIKSTKGEEFKNTETNYYELYHLSKEWGTYELTSILKDYGKRHESDMSHTIEEYLYLMKEYDHQKEENLRKQFYKREHKNIIKISQIKMVEENMKNQMDECFKAKIFWEIKIDTIYRLDLLFKCIIESIEERKKLIELIDPMLISEENQKKLVDLQYNYNSINMNLIIDLLQSHQESDIMIIRN